MAQVHITKLFRGQLDKSTVGYIRVVLMADGHFWVTHGTETFNRLYSAYKMGQGPEYLEYKRKYPGDMIDVIVEPYEAVGSPYEGHRYPPAPVVDMPVVWLDFDINTNTIHLRAIRRKAYESFNELQLRVHDDAELVKSVKLDQKPNLLMFSTGGNNFLPFANMLPEELMA